MFNIVYAETEKQCYISVKCTQLNMKYRFFGRDWRAMLHYCEVDPWELEMIFFYFGSQLITFFTFGGCGGGGLMSLKINKVNFTRFLPHTDIKQTNHV